jgi:hypothetical protein
MLASLVRPKKPWQCRTCEDYAAAYAEGNRDPELSTSTYVP